MIADRQQRRSLDRIASGAAALLDVPLVLITVLDRGRQIVVGAHGLLDHVTQPSLLCRDVALSDKPIVVQDTRRRLSSAARHGWGFELVAYAGLPLSIEGARGGTLGAFSPHRRNWQSHDLLVLRSLASAASAVLDMQSHVDSQREITKQQLAAKSAAYANLESRAADAAVETSERERLTNHDHRRITLELENVSVHDELTGLLNRRGLFSTGATHLAALRRDKLSGLLLYIDIDGLKTTNDRGGHAAGDELLRDAANVLRSTFRDTDTIVRMGGDEFVVLTTDSPSREQPVLARLAAELRRCNDQRDPALPLAWSLGLVSVDATEALSLDSLMCDADRRMYAAKQSLRAVTLPSSSVIRRSLRV